MSNTTFIANGHVYLFSVGWEVLELNYRRWNFQWNINRSMYSLGGACMDWKHNSSWCFVRGHTLGRISFYRSGVPVKHKSSYSLGGAYMDWKRNSSWRFIRGHILGCISLASYRSRRTYAEIDQHRLLSLRVLWIRDLDSKSKDRQQVKMNLQRGLRMAGFLGVQKRRHSGIKLGLVCEKKVYILPSLSTLARLT